MTEIHLTRRALDKKAGMTFAQLRQFVSDAMHLDMPDDARLRVTIGWSAQIQSITVEQAYEEESN